MYYAFVLYNLALERISAYIPISAAESIWLRRAIWQRLQRRVEAVPFFVYPLALSSLSLLFNALVAHAHSLEPLDTTWQNLPLGLIHDARWDSVYPRIRPLLFATVCLQSLALAALYTSIRNKRPTRIDVALTVMGVGILLALAVSNRLLESTDIYSYIVNARMGMLQSYGNHIVIADPDLQRITAFTWGTLPPSPYGPLWQGYNAMIANSASLAQAVMRLRLFNGLIFVALLGGLILARVRFSTITLVALNPYFYQQFIVNAHNDLAPIAALILGAAFARKSIGFAVAASIAAGLIKLPLCLVGIATLAAVQSRWTRWILAAAILSAVALLSVAFGGRPYVAALLAASGSALTTGRPQFIMHAAAAALAVASIGYALYTRHRYWPGTTGILAFGASLYPWYLIWMLPIAFVGVDIAAPFLVALPAGGFLLSAVYETPSLLRAICFGAVGLAAVTCIRFSSATDVSERRGLRGLP